MYNSRVCSFMQCSLLSSLQVIFEVFVKKFNNNHHFITKRFRMSGEHNLKPPEHVRGMVSLDKEKFNNTVSIPALKLPNSLISKAVPLVKKYFFKMRDIKPVQPLNDGTHSQVLFSPEMVKSWLDVAEPLKPLPLTEENFTYIDYVIKYENYHASEIFKAVLPGDQNGFSSFSQIGHIVHINLREHLFSYKSVIGQVLLDKIPNVRTVINKIDMIDNTYRYFKKELLCGEDDMMVKMKENKCLFEFDFSKVYWNPRLSTEHERIVEMLRPGDVLFDVFAGVGPFAIPAAKKKCIVFANDLNPESFKWLNHNSKINKIDGEYLKTFNLDGRDFILQVVKSNFLKHLNKSNIHIAMNLPAVGVEFLNAFCSMFSEEELVKVEIVPIIHVYCFAKGEDCETIAKELVFKNVGLDISDKLIKIFKVRTVSNFKEMMRVSFWLDRDILVSNKRKHKDCIAEHDKKRRHGEEQVQAEETYG